MNKKAETVLEYNRIIDLLADRAGSDAAKARVRALAPMSNKRMVSDALTETTEAVSVILYKGSIPVGDFTDVSGLADAAKKMSILSMRDLKEIARNLKITGEVKRFLSSDVPETKFISEIASLLLPSTELARDIDRAIITPDEMADDASPDLRAIRRSISLTNEAIRGRLQGIISSGTASKYLQDMVVTVRNGRYVIPVKKEYANAVPGIIHDRSATGATVFIEPQIVATYNNELKTLMLKEEAEIAAILSDFSMRVAGCADSIKNNQKLLAELDLINAKGKLSVDMGAFEPHLNDEGYIDIRRGRHPLIDKEKVVPIDVSIGKGFRTLLITGPNTGGKTITLKTIGLFVLMTMSGLHVPCSEESSIPVLNEVFADIGDEQSIEQSLSTFSAHMKNICEIVERADENSLVLLDELGAGTDPAEGAALGIALLEKISSSGALTAATTHYTELKKYALSTGGVENASMEFDVDTLSPTYHLRMGLPGRSNAFEISRKLGLEEGVIKRATELMSGKELEFEDAVSSIENEKKAAAEMLAEAERKNAEAEKYLEDARKRTEDAARIKERALDDAQAEADEDLSEFKALLEEATAELREIKKREREDTGRATSDINELRRRIGDSEKKLKKRRKPAVQSDAAGPAEKVKAEDLKVGTGVKLLTIDQNGTVESLPDESGNLVVRVGSLKINAKVSDLMLIDEEAIQDRKKRSYAKLSSRKAQTVRASINLIGKNLDDAVMELSKYIDDAYIAGMRRVTVIHGRGEGILKNGLRKELAANPFVESYKSAPYSEGGEGATVVTLKNG